MDTWERDYDSWKTTPPEAPDSDCKCAICGEDLYEGEDIYVVEDEVLCVDCAEEWFADHKTVVTYEMEHKYA